MTKRNPEINRSDLVLNTRISNRLQRIARMIEKELEKAGADKDRVSFSLLIWGPGRMQYCSNAERSDVRNAMQEMVTKWDKDGEDLGPVRLPLGGFGRGDH